MGRALEVHSLPRRREQGGVIVDREPTSLDDLADLVINAEIGPKLEPP